MLDARGVRALRAQQVIPTPGPADPAPVLAIDYHAAGQALAVTDQAGHVSVINALDGTVALTVRTDGAGAAALRFTHHASSVVVAPDERKRDAEGFTPRQLCLHSNQYTREFAGHAGWVRGLAMHPSEDLLLSWGDDGCALLWALEQREPVAALRAPSQQRRAAGAGAGAAAAAGRAPCAAFDNTGRVFAVALPGEIKLYDLQGYDRGPFGTVRLPAGGDRAVDVAFSPDGAVLLVTTAGNDCLLFDAFEYHLLRTLSVPETGAEGRAGKACFSPDARFVFRGAADGTVHSWAADTGDAVAQFDMHAGPVAAVAWNPKFAQMASGCASVVLWGSSSSG